MDQYTTDATSVYDRGYISRILIYPLYRSEKRQRCFLSQKGKEQRLFCKDILLFLYQHISRNQGATGLFNCFIPRDWLIIISWRDRACVIIIPPTYRQGTTGNERTQPFYSKINLLRIRNDDYFLMLIMHPNEPGSMSQGSLAGRMLYATGVPA